MSLSPHLRLLPWIAVGLVVLLVGLHSLRGGSGESGASGAPASIAADDSSGAAGAGGLEIGSADRTLVIDVAGAVRQPGVYRLEPGSRVIDAIQRAGGPSHAAMPSAINRAAKLADGQQVVLPSRVASGQGPAATTASASASGGGSAPISLGSATAEQLEQIDGIGPVTAADIIEFRDSKGGLSSIDQIDEVSGIGPVTMEALRSSLQP